MSRASFATILAKPMPTLSPRITLLLLLGLAVVILGGGLRLARQEETVRIDRDREALRRFAGDTQAELQRLDNLYESHLSRLARTLPDDAFVIRREADRIVGVRQFSLLRHRTARRADDVHVQISGRTPMPAFAAPRGVSARELVLLDEAKLLGDGAARSGWIDEPGKPLIFWQRRSAEEVAMLMIDPAAVETSDQSLV